MSRIIHISLLWLLFGGLTMPSARAQETLTGDIWAHDPSTIVKEGSRYYYFSTGSGIPYKYSTDLHHWTYTGQIRPSGPPAWAAAAVPGHDPGNWAWAPDVAYFNGRYHVYYSVSEWGTIDSVIGLFTSPSLISPTWTDQGKVVQSDASCCTQSETDTTTFNCIDPAILQDTNGTIWMVFGSYSDGIVVTQIDPSTGKRMNPASIGTKIADNGPNFFDNTTEASFLYQRGGYYYLFLNFGGCCQGVDSTYNIRVGRSSSVTGPFYDRSGQNMLNGGGTLLLASSGRYIGPGHAGILTVNGTDWLSYHYYDGLDNGVAKLGINQLHWSPDGWPSATGSIGTFAPFYTFEADARDHLGLNDGLLIGGATVVTESNRGSVLQLDGVDDYVQLPASMSGGRTFAAWVKWSGQGGDWQRIFDFGDGNTGGTSGKYLFLTARAYDGANGKLRFAITTAGNQNEEIIEAPYALPTNTWTHVAVTLDGALGLLYVNGQPVATNDSMTLNPSQVFTLNSYIGKSQWPDDLFNGRIDSFRVFSRALSGDEIRALAYAQPTLAHRYSFSNGTADSVGDAHGTLMGNAVVTNGTLVLAGVDGDYLDLPGGLVSGCDAVTLEFWATFGANGLQARVFDFGDDSHPVVGLNFIAFTPNNGADGHRFTIATSGGTVNLDGTGNLSGQTVHVVCIADPAAGYTAIYTNGVLESEWVGAVPALSNVSSAKAFLGQSMWPSHPALNAGIDEFRIYDGRLTAEDIAANFRAGPDELAIPVRLERERAPGALTFRWPDYAVGFHLESILYFGPGLGEWTPGPDPSSVQGSWHEVTVPVTVSNEVFRLSR